MSRRTTITHNGSAHPEARMGETFVSNMNVVQFEAFGWNSKRIGLIAYDGEGRQLSFPNWFPVFVQEAELREREVHLADLRHSLQEQRRAA